MIVQENILAALAGAAASSIGFYKRGLIVVLQVFISGFFLSYFGTVNLIDWIKVNYGVLGSYSIVYFLVAYFGNLILERSKTWLASVKVSLWKQ